MTVTDDMECHNCGHKFFNTGQMGDSITDGACENCGEPYAHQPNPLNSDMAMRDMPAPGEEDMGGNPLQEGIMGQIDGGWDNRMKRDESFASSRRSTITPFHKLKMMGEDPSHLTWQQATERLNGIVQNAPPGKVPFVHGPPQPQDPEMRRRVDEIKNRDRFNQMSEVHNPELGTRGWSPGEVGRGIIDEHGQLHTWPEEHGSHVEYMRKKGIDPAPILTGDSGMCLAIEPDGKTRRYGGDGFIPSQLHPALQAGGLYPGQTNPQKSLMPDTNNVSLDDLFGDDDFDFTARTRIFSVWNADDSRLATDLEVEQIIPSGPHTVEVDAPGQPIILQHADQGVLDAAKLHLEARTAAPLAIPAAELAAPEIGAGAAALAPEIGAGAAAIGGGAEELASGGAGLLRGLLGGGAKKLPQLARGLMRGVVKNQAIGAGMHALGIGGAGDGGAMPPPTQQETPSALLSHTFFGADQHPDDSDDNLTERSDGNPDDVDGKEFKDGEDKGLFQDDMAGGSAWPSHQTLDQMDSLIPLLMHYYHGEEDGSSDPMVMALHEALDKERPGYLDEEPEGDQDPEVMALINHLTENSKDHGMEKESEPKHAGAPVGVMQQSPMPAINPQQQQGIMPQQTPGGPVAQNNCPYCGGTLNPGQPCPQCHASVAGGAPPQAPPMGPTVMAAVDSLADKCPNCGGHTTGFISDDNDCGCKTCGHHWKSEKKLNADVTARWHNIVAYEPGTSASQWVDQTGQELQPDKKYEMHSANYDIPDLVTIKTIKPDGINYEIGGEYGISHPAELTRDEADMEGTTFIAADDGVPDPSTNSEATGFSGAPEQSDLSTPHMQMAASKRFSGPPPPPGGGDPSMGAGAPPGAPMDPSMGMPPPPPPPPGSEGHQGPQSKEQFAAVAKLLQDSGRGDEIVTMLSSPQDYADELAQVQQKDPPSQLPDSPIQPPPPQEEAPPGDTMPVPNPADNVQPLSSVQEDVGPDWLRDEIPDDSRTAGAHFTPMEQRELIDEQGEARNSGKLDLSNTHYLEEDSDAALFM